MARAEVRKEAFWLYGIIAGLAVREALLKVVELSADHPAIRGIEVFRLFFFLFILIQFYLNAAVYFKDVYDTEGCEKKYAKQNFGVDFMTGFVHAVLFFWWATTVDMHQPYTKFGISLFFLGYLMIQFYCCAWLVAAAQFDTFRRLGLTALLNVLTALVSIAVYTGASLLQDSTAPRIELVALLFPAVVSAIQLGEMFKGKPFFARHLSKLIPPSRDPPKAPPPGSGTGEPVSGT